MHANDYQRRKDAWFDLSELEPAALAQRLDAIARDDAALAAALHAQFAAAGQPVALLDRASAVAGAPALPQYRVLRELGRGGMGRVWLAERRIGDAVQQVALKQILHGAWHAEDRRRFERERRILAGLAHPNIAALVDGGSDADGVPWLATAYVDGERLDRHVERAKPDLATRVRLLSKIAAAVDHAHRHLVVHRDLKPANILVDRAGEPKLLDFGIARLLGEEAITTTGSSQMTLRYAAPERVRGEGDATAVASDVYALGVLLYELLAGASPHGDTRDQSALIAAILHDVPVPPSSRTGLAGVDADLDAIVLKALRKRPQDRYAGADAFAADLERWLAREPVEARRGERGYRARAWLRRRWAWPVAAALLLGALAYHLQALDRELDRAEAERDRAQALAGYFGELFKGARPADTERGDISARELLERSVADLHRDAQRPAATRAAMLMAAGNALGYIGRSAKARDAYALAVELLRGASADPETLARALSELASHRYLAADRVAARRDIDEALALVEAGHVGDPHLPITLLQQAAMMDEEGGEIERARVGYERAIELARPLLHTREGLESYLAAQTNIATWDMRENATLPQAEERLREAIATARREGFDDPYSLFPMRTYLARVLYDQYKLAEARDVLDPVVAEARAWYGKDDTWFGLILSHAATLAMLERRGDEAIALFEEAMGTQVAHDEEHPNRWAMRSDRAIASIQREDWSDAITRLEAVLAWRARSGRADGDNAKFERAALAWARCRAAPDAAARSALEDSLFALASFRGWKRWLASEWRGACGGVAVPASGS